MSAPDFAVRGLRVLITGSTRGIGAALARAFLEGGAKVFVHGRSEDSCREFTSAHGGHPVPGDLEAPDGPAQVAESVLAVSDTLDTLIHNAGFEAYLPLEAYDMQVFDRIQRVNLRAPVELTHRLLPALRRSTNASIINITSIHESVPSPNNSAYSMAKAALAMFTKCLAVELGPLGLRANTIAPGAIETDMNREIIDTMGRENWAKWIPSGRVGTADEIAGAALYLASPASRYMNGGCLVLDGGYSHNLVRYRHAE
jgi:NAD(P)-dependent dehydrogenase (short-subunit alcohol dehydrogenase family)